MGRTIGMLGAVAMLFAASGARADSLGFAGSVTWFGQVPIMVAIDKGFFKEQGLDIEYQVILNSSDRLASVDAGSSAFSNLGRSSVIPAMARGDSPDELRLRQVYERGVEYTDRVEFPPRIGAAGDPVALDANYVRRSDAELLFKPW